MILSRLSRRVVAGLAAALLLACQTAAVAHACTMPSLHSDAAAQKACHHPAEDTANTGTDVDGRCQHATPAPAGLSILTAADFPAIRIRIDPLVAAGTPAPAAAPVLRVEPPPLTILHCRLRN